MNDESVADALVRAGVELLEETGSSEVSLRAITRRAGVSHGAPRHWFPTHAALLAAIAKTGFADLTERIHRAAKTASDGAGRIAAAAHAYVDFAAERPAMFVLMFRHNALEASGADLRASSLPLFEWLTLQLDQTGDRIDVDDRAAALWTGVHGIAVLHSSGALPLAAPDVTVERLISNIVASQI